MSAGKARALFITAKQKSLGETFTAAAFAHELEAENWETCFLAFEYAVRFLQDQKLRVITFTAQKQRNQTLLAQAIEEFQPQLIFTADFYLLQSAEMSTIWCSNWLFRYSSLPLVTFDHIQFHPNPRTILIAYNRVIQGPQANAYSYRIDPLPARIRAIVRPCPANNLVSDDHARIFKYRARYSPANETASARKWRDRMGIGTDEKIVFVPVSSWAVHATQQLHIPYHDLYPQLLSRYFARSRNKVRIVLVCNEFSTAQVNQGNVTLHYVAGLSFEQMQSVLCASDLVIADNIISTCISRAVMSGIPAAVFTSSVDTVYETGQACFKAPFPLTATVLGVLREMERKAPNSVFPFVLYPLGWKDALHSVFHQNPYANTFEQLELFDERRATECLEKLLYDPSVRGTMQNRQASYAADISRLPSAGAVARQIMQCLEEGRTSSWNT